MGQAGREGNKESQRRKHAVTALWSRHRMLLYHWIIIAQSDLCSVTKPSSIYLPRVLWAVCRLLTRVYSGEMWRASLRQLMSDWLLLLTPLHRWQMNSTTRELILLHPFPTWGNWTIICLYCVEDGRKQWNYDWIAKLDAAKINFIS